VGLQTRIEALERARVAAEPSVVVLKQFDNENSLRIGLVDPCPGVGARRDWVQGPQETKDELMARIRSDLGTSPGSLYILIKM